MSAHGPQRAKAREIRQWNALWLCRAALYTYLPLCVLDYRKVFSDSSEWDAMESFMPTCYLGAMLIIVVEPALAREKVLDRLLIALSCTRLVYILFVARRMFEYSGWKDYQIWDVVFHGALGVVLGNARLAILLNFLLVALTTGLQLFGNLICCDGGALPARETGLPEREAESVTDWPAWVQREVVIPICVFLGCAIMAWVKETSEHFWAGMMIQTQVAQQQEALSRRLLSEMCDACAHLGPQLEIVRGAEQLGRVLGRDAAASGRLVGRRFTQLIVDGEVGKVEDFLCSSRDAHAEEAAENARRHVSMRTQMRDAYGVIVSVELFHGCLKIAGEDVHIVGIREEQDRFSAVAQQRALAQEADASVEHPHLETDSSSCSSSEHEHAEQAAAPEWSEPGEAHAVVDLVADDYPVTCGTPAFQVLLGIRMSDRAIPLGSLLHGGHSELEAFEGWALSSVVGRSEEEIKGARAHQLTFHHPGLHPLGVKLSARCTLQPVSPGKVQMTLASISWDKGGKLLSIAKPKARAKKKRDKTQSARGTPWQQEGHGLERSSGSCPKKRDNTQSAQGTPEQQEGGGLEQSPCSSTREHL